MIAVIDETTPHANGGILYAVVSVVLLADEETARDALTTVLPARKRPFHWNQEGPQARMAMCQCLVKVGAVARAIVVPCGRKAQERARAIALNETISELLREGCTTVIIESRGRRDDKRDQGVILDLLRKQPDAELTYSWAGKTEPILWLADAVGGGVREHLVGNKAQWMPRIQQATSLAINYRAL